MPTYKEQYEKIIQAYFKDEIQPYNQQFCFCGTLLSGESWWDEAHKKNTGSGGYTAKQIVKMERALLLPLYKLSGFKRKFNYLLIDGGARYLVKRHPDYEDVLFKGMSAALDVLKNIHEKRGENVDVIETQFVKRKLTANV